MASLVQPVDLEPAPAAGLTGIWRKAFSFPALLAALLVGAVFAAERAFYVDPDAWMHLKVGETILRTHTWPTTDPYSFTVPGAPWMAYEWLGDVLLAAVQRAAGLRGLAGLEIALAAATVLALYALAALRSGNSKAAFVACAATLLLAELSFTLRPQMLGYLFLLLALIALELFRQGRHRTLWLLPALFLLWVNTHGSFMIGLGAIALYWAGGLVEFHAGGLEARRWTPAERQRLALVFLLCLIALTLTSYGTRIAVYPFDIAFGQPVGVASIAEYRSMPFDLAVGKLFLALILLFLLAQVLWRPTYRLEEIALFLFGTCMACLHARFMLVFVPFFAPLLAVLLARWVPPYQQAKDRHALNATLIALVVAGITGFFPSRAELERRVAESYPAGAVEYLRHHSVPGPMYNQYGYGGYLIGSLAPAHKVFIDGRSDIYERGGVLSDYLRIAGAAPGTLAILRGYGVRSCLIERNEPLATLLAASPDWQQAYADRVSALFVRRGSPQRHSAAAPQPKGGSKQ